jgi:N-formylglutamate deformylase
MAALRTYSIEDIKTNMAEGRFPFGGITTLGSAKFVFEKPSSFAGVALHAGSAIRSDLQAKLAVSETDRYREEDPGTDQLIRELPIRVVALDSRFEYDLNRPEDKAIPLTPEMAWGLDVWKTELSAKEKEASLLKYREFHRLIDLVSDYLVSQGEQAFIFDLHSYCYQRDKRLPWWEDPKPAINLGTGGINEPRFREAIDDLLDSFSRISAGGRQLTVAENEVFKGGYLARKLCARHYDHLAVFAIEFKKIFMDEWSGEFYPAVFNDLAEQFSKLLATFMKRHR